MNLNVNDILWTYKDNNWSCNILNSNLCNQLVTLGYGDGFWIRTTTDKNITLPDTTNTDEKNIYAGWNIFSPVLSDLNISDKYSSTNAYSIWTYTYNNGWKLWTPDNAHTELGLETITSIKQYEGAWVNSKINILNSNILIGQTNTSLSDGNFSKVTKLNNDTLSNIWDISFKISDFLNKTFKIGIYLSKEVSGAFGHITYHNLNITNKIINTPSIIEVFGQKSDGTKGGLSLSSNIISNSISYSNDYLTLHLGEIMNLQDIIPASSFTTISNYKIKIIVDTINIDNSKLSTFIFKDQYQSDAYTFSNSPTIEGEIEIK